MAEEEEVKKICCNTCPYVETMIKSDIGMSGEIRTEISICRRNPIVPRLSGPGWNKIIHPNSDWCGEHPDKKMEIDQAHIIELVGENTALSMDFINLNQADDLDPSEVTIGSDDVVPSEGQPRAVNSIGVPHGHCSECAQKILPGEPETYKHGFPPDVRRHPHGQCPKPINPGDPDNS